MLRRTNVASILFATLIACSVTTASPAFAQQEKVLYSFGATPQDGTEPANLISDKAGNLYGIASEGANGNGAIFQLAPQTGGGWTEKIIYSFCSQANCADGATPRGTLVFDAAGNLYGSAVQGGAYGIGSGGYGTVFELSPASGGNWTETVLHSFGSGTDGALPYAGLIFDAAGNLYGTTSDNLYNGPYGYGLYSSGTVYELSPQVGGAWAEKILHRWYDEGQALYVGLVLDAAGNLYSSTTSGSSRGGRRGVPVVARSEWVLAGEGAVRLRRYF
jgi:hypothetical protein